MKIIARNSNDVFFRSVFQTLRQSTFSKRNQNTAVYERVRQDYVCETDPVLSKRLDNRHIHKEI